MNRVLFIFLTVLLSCQNGKKEKDSGMNRPVTRYTAFEFTEEVHDFGVIDAGEIVVYAFEMKNTGNAEFTVEQALADCGCISVRHTEQVIKPGDAGWIEVEFNSSGLYGKQLKSIEIYVGTTEPKYLTIFADVRNKQLEFNY